MAPTTGRDSSSSLPNTWPGEHAHRGPHFTLLVWPDGRLILATPDELSEQQFLTIREAFNQWTADPSSDPLMIGACQVVFQPLAPQAEVVRVSQMPMKAIGL